MNSIEPSPAARAAATSPTWLAVAISLGRTVRRIGCGSQERLAYAVPWAAVALAAFLMLPGVGAVQAQGVSASNQLPAPGLTILTQTDGQMLICWPDPAPGWLLQYTPSLSSPIGWQGVTLPAVIIGDKQGVRIDPAKGLAFFYRLYRPPQLPIFKVTGVGVTGAQFEILSSMLRLPGSAYGQDGSVHFTDPKLFQEVPTQVLEQGGADENKLPVVTEGFLFDQIKTIAVLDDATALLLARDALGQSKLTPPAPYQTTAQLDHSMFEAVDSKGGELATQPLDTQVHYPLQLGGIPVVGPGARINLVFNGEKAATRVTYALRQVTESDTLPILGGSEAEAMAMEAYQGTAGGKAEVKLSSRLVYFAPTTDQTSVQTILPYYEFGGTLMVSGGKQSVPLRRTLLPAIRDPRFLPTVGISAQQDGNALTAQSVVSGGVSPYSYQWSSSTGSLTPTNTPSVSYLVSAGKESPVLETLTLNVTDANGVTASASQTFTMDVKVPTFALQGARQSGGLYSAGTEWVGTSMGLGGSAANANGFLVRFLLDNLFNGGSTVPRFNWGDYNAWERDFRDPVFGGDDGNWVDSVDVVFYTGHANDNGWSFPGTHDDDFLNYTEARYGNNYNLEWLVIAACGPLQAGSAGNLWYQRWGPAFRGLHLLCGYQTVTSDNTVEGTKWADYMVRGWTVRQAWMQTGIEVQGASERVAVMGVIGPSGSSNWNDHYWGKGTTGPDILDVRGWWMVSSPCD